MHIGLISRHGRLALDAYFPGYAWDYEGEGFRGGWTEFGPETLHNLASVTKSVTGLLAGIAIDRGDLPGLDAAVFSFFPEYAHLSDEGKAGINLAHLLTMTSGLQWNEQDVFYSEVENDIVQLFVVSDPIEHVLSKKLVNPPGSQWYYNGGGTNLLGEIIQRSSGDRLDVFAQKHLFSPLQISDAEWIFIQPDFVYASGDMKLRSRDLAKLGQLVLSGGTWRGTRVVSEEWVQEMTRTQVPLGPSQGYGYHWWTRTYTDGSASISAFLADGWGGQRVMGFPSLDLVVVFTGGNYTQQHRLDEIVTRYILPAIAN
jgi:CubicO group peptidase (beta-lactamase class C family)